MYKVFEQQNEGLQPSLERVLNDTKSQNLTEGTERDLASMSFPLQMY